MLLILLVVSKGFWEFPCFSLGEASTATRSRNEEGPVELVRPKGRRKRHPEKPAKNLQDKFKSLKTTKDSIKSLKHPIKHLKIPTKTIQNLKNHP